MRQHSPDDGNGFLADVLAATGVGGVVAFGVWFLLVTIMPVDAATYHRSERTVTLKHAVRPVTLARSRTPEDTSTARYFIAHEIAALARCEPETVLPAGRRVRLPRYVRVSRDHSGDLRNWHCAVVCGNKYGVSPSLLVAMRTHECPLPKWDFKALGCKCFCDDCRHGRGAHPGWKHGGIWGQYASAARTVRRVARGDTDHEEWDWDPDDPTAGNVLSLGIAYCEGSRSWGKAVWAIRQRILRSVD